MFSDLIKRLPVADVSFKGVTGYMLRGEEGLVVFFEFAEDSIVPPHRHGTQWGTVVSGRVELTLNGETYIYGPGDTYSIKAGEVHSAVIAAGTCVIDVFEEVDRYRPRTAGEA
jgi:quercetin dioxygenase-like cupin family protein